MAILVGWAWLVSVMPAALPAEGRGFQAERRVREATRLEWEFAAGPRATLPGNYDSRRQQYQLHVPKGYDAKRAWPLLVVVSPGDVPLGWSAWQHPCEQRGWFFAAPYGAGASVAPAQRVRAVLDVMDDVRREYRIDPEQTYFVGVGRSAEVAAHLATSYPEYCGGIVALGGDVPMPRLAHLRHRMADRLSVALVSGRNDPGRAQQEAYLAPMFQEVGIRARFWETGEGPAGLPTAATLGAVMDWLEGDVKRRREDATAAGLEVEDTPNRRRLASRTLQRARAMLPDAGKSYRTAALLEWIVARCGEVPDGQAAAELLRELREDEVRSRLIARQGEAEVRRGLVARARGHERKGDLEAARRAWDGAARLSEGDEAKQTRAEERRLAGMLARSPFLGVTFAGATLLVKSVTVGGPAGKAGVQEGDGIVSLNGERLTTPEQLGKLIRSRRPGDEVILGLRREGKLLAVTVCLGAADAGM